MTSAITRQDRPTTRREVEKRIAFLSSILPKLNPFLGAKVEEAIFAYSVALAHMPHPVTDVWIDGVEVQPDGTWITVEAERAFYVDEGVQKVLCDGLPSPVTLVIRVAQ